jgi:nucleotide-binding universal stress UspA family protein
MERALQLQASQARRALMRVAEQVEAEWTFRVVRGLVAAEVLEAALEADLLSLGRASRPFSARTRLGSTAQAALRAPRSVLLARHGIDLQQPIAVTYDGSDAAARALMAAVKMAQVHDSNLIIVVLSEDLDDAPLLAERANEWLEERVPQANYRYLAAGSSARLVAILQREECGLVVLGGEFPPLQGEALQELLDELDYPVLLVR